MMWSVSVRNDCKYPLFVTVVGTIHIAEARASLVHRAYMVVECCLRMFIRAVRTHTHTYYRGLKNYLYYFGGSLL